MAYHTPLYLLLFLPPVLLAYQLLPRKRRYLALLFFSGLFAVLFSRRTALYLLFSAAVVFAAGRFLEYLKETCEAKSQAAGTDGQKAARAAYRRRGRIVLTGTVVLLLSALAWFKYYNFFAMNASCALKLLGIELPLPQRNLLIPVGISFYTLEEIGYLTDVFRGRQRAETNFGRLLLFFCFFPKLMEGPICSYVETGQELRRGDPVSRENLFNGTMRILCGLAKKMVAADRLHVFVGRAFGEYENYGGCVAVLAAVCYTVQLYLEFSGCMDIVLGSGQLFGVKLPENFRRPFFARSVSEFWRRWHITLGAWLRTYVFYSASVSAPVKKWNRFGKRHLSRYAAGVVTSALVLFPVWLCNGLWHGPRWTYLFYGIYYFLLLLAGIVFEPLRNRALAVLRIDPESALWRTVQHLKMGLIIVVGELIFRAEHLSQAASMLKRAVLQFHAEQLWDGTLLSMGMSRADWLAVLACCLLVGGFELLAERGTDVPKAISEAGTPVRWGVWYALLFGVVIFGAYGTGYQAVDLIYAGF